MRKQVKYKKGKKTMTVCRTSNWIQEQRLFALLAVTTMSLYKSLNYLDGSSPSQTTTALPIARLKPLAVLVVVTETVIVRKWSKHTYKYF